MRRHYEAQHYSAIDCSGVCDPLVQVLAILDTAGSESMITRIMLDNMTKKDASKPGALLCAGRSQGGPVLQPCGGLQTCELTGFCVLPPVLQRAWT